LINSFIGKRWNGDEDVNGIKKRRKGVKDEDKKEMTPR
jgi:hypothetical protein